MDERNYKLIAFTEDGLSLDVRVDAEKETVWLTQAEMAELFGVDRTRIVRHLSNIYKDGELDKSATCAENAQAQRVAMCGKRTLQMPIAQRWLSCFNDPYRREQSRGKRNHGGRDHEHYREIDI